MQLFNRRRHSIDLSRKPRDVFTARLRKVTRFSLLLVLMGTLVVTTALAFYYHKKYTALVESTSVRELSVQEIIAAIDRDAVLPSGEDPYLATVADPAVLSKNPLFKDAKEGDRVLIYPKAQKAYLWSTTEKRLIREGVYP